MDLSKDRQGRELFTADKRTDIAQRFSDLVNVMARLRKECPWDQKQTPDSLKRYVLEETYEVLAAIEDRDWEGLREELGDFLLQVLFLAEIMRGEEHFDIEDVLEGITDKMVRRHPHVFGDTNVESSDQVVVNWEAIKAAEKGEQGLVSLFDHFPKGLPALLESFKIGKKAAKVGFDWPEPARVLDKVEEEIAEIREALAAGQKEQVQEEMGDLFFAVSNLTRKLGLEPEETLRGANRKFIQRFRAMEDLAREDDVDFAALDLDQQESYWQRAKAKLRETSGE